MSQAKTTYQTYTSDESVAKEYARRQARFSETPMESEKILIEIAKKAVRDLGGDALRLSLIDLGCSTGNFLYHLKNAVPGLTLTGLDLMESIVAAAQRDPRLEGVNITRQDMLAVDDDQQYDITVFNKSLCFFTEEQHQLAMRNAAKITKPGGVLIIFDWMTPWFQDLEILEKTKWHKDGLRIFYRSYDTMTRSAGQAGFGDPTFQPFDIPIDLAASSDLTDHATFTVQSQSGERLQFRGCLSQPWCFMTARLGE